MKKLLFVIVVVALVAGCTQANATKTPTPAAAPKKSSLGGASAQGYVTPVRRADLSFRTGGRVAQVLVKEGDPVKAGQPLVKLQDAELKAALASAQADLKRLQAGSRAEEIAAAQANLDVANGQVKAAQNDVDKVKNGAQQVADVAAAQAQLAQAKTGVDGSFVLGIPATPGSDSFLYLVAKGGKPAAIWAGLQEAQGELILTTDMDQSTPIAELDKLLPWCEQGYDVVIGSRGTAREGFSLVRRAGSFVFGTLRGLALLRGIADTQCGFKLYRREVVQKYFPYLEAICRSEKPRGWKVTAFDIELLFLIEKAGYKIKEVVVDWCNRDQSDTKSQTNELARYVNESIDMARQVVRVKLNQLKGLYDKV